MSSTDVEVLQTAADWLAQSRRVLLGTVVRTWGSSPRPPGSWVAIRDDGQIAGSVSGGCIEDDLVDRVRRGELALARPESTVYGSDAEEARRFGLPCGGTVQIVLEPLGGHSRLDELLCALRQRRSVARCLDMVSGLVSLEAYQPSEAVVFDGRTLKSWHGPRPRLLLIGAGQLSRCLAQMSVMLGHEVTVCDPRSEYHESCQGLEGVDLSTQMPDDLVQAMALDANSAVVALSHDPKLDDLALMEALKTQAYYVGALGSKRNNDARRLRLLQFDLDLQQVQTMRGPVGFRLGGRTPPEIALAILAELTAARHGTLLDRSWTDWSSSSTECRLLP